ncbi:MAG: hypothetical protein CMH81_06820 [Nitrospiraceae bacterium]|nr:hypothetical protein [Nitrospiraceae bacterium]
MNRHTQANQSQMDSDVRALLAELQKVSKRSCEECIQSLPAALERCDIKVIRLWIDLGIEIASSSGATGIRYFKESLAFLIALKKAEHQERVLTAAIQMINVDDDAKGAGACLAFECVRRGGVAVGVLAETSLDEWMAIGMDIGKWNTLAAVEYFRESPAVLQVIPFDHLKRWAECGIKLVTTNQFDNFDYLLTVEFFRMTSQIFSAIPELEMRLRVLDYGNQLADQSPHVAMAFLKQSPNAVAAIIQVPEGCSADEEVSLREEGNARFEQWVSAGMQALEYSVEAARAYFAYESRWALVSIERAMSGVSIQTMRRSLRLLVTGLSGKDIRIETHRAHATASTSSAMTECPVEQPRVERPPCLQDTVDSIVLPSVLNSYPRKSDNARLYRVMAAHKAGHFEFGTHELRIDSLRDLVADLHSRYGQSHWPASVWEVFALYPSPALAQDLWMIVEDARVDSRLAREYPGLRRDMDRVVKEAVIQRPLFQSGSLRDMVVEALMRMSVNQSTDGIPASCQEILDQARPMFAEVQDVRTTCEVALRMADRLYRLLDVLSPMDSSLSETASLVPDSQGSQPDEGDHTQQGNGFAYHQVTNLAHRGVAQSVPNEGVEFLDRQILEVDAFQDEETSDSQRVFHYDEWDATLGDYRSRWCRVVEDVGEAKAGGEAFVARTLADHQWTIQRLRKYFEGIRPSALRWVKNQLDGENVDMDAAIDWLAERRAHRAPSDRVFMNREMRVRNVSAAVLMDMSGSTNRLLDPNGKRVIEVEKEALILLCEALEALGDRYAIYGFSGRSRHDVRFTILKEFDHVYDSRCKQRIGAIEPVHQNRDGVAIRHAVAKLRHERAKVKLLLLLSDGRPLDDQYERDYALEDTRMALLEAKRLGIHPFCVTIDREAPTYLSRMCGEVGFMVVDQVGRLPDCLPHIYRRLTT